MKILGHVVFLLLIGEICCQNNRNAKPSGKSSKKNQGNQNQGAEAAQSAPEDEPHPGPVESGREGNSGGRAAAQQSASQNNKASDDMKLHVLKNTQVTCNDGTAAG